MPFKTQARVGCASWKATPPRACSPHRQRGPFWTPIRGHSSTPFDTDGGAPQLVRIVARRADAVTDFGDARLWSETTRIDLRVAEVPAPRPGDRIEIDGDAFLIQGEPVRDRERLVWTVDLRPA